jgi:hypothetical protein
MLRQTSGTAALFMNHLEKSERRVFPLGNRNGTFYMQMASLFRNIIILFNIREGQAANNFWKTLVSRAPKSLVSLNLKASLTKI